MKKILLIGALCLFGCEKPNWTKLHLDNLNYSFEYYKDMRTNLCFAGMYNSSITNVPCTPEVEKIAHPFRSER